MSHDTWIHRIVRVGVRPLVNTPVTPNHLTTLRIATGLAATGAFATGTPGGYAWGGGVFVVSMLLDRADGELARLGGKTSPFGHKFDLIGDAFCNAIVFAGLGFGLRDGSLGLWGAVLGAIAGAGIAAILTLMLRMETLEGEGAGEIHGAAGFDIDDAVIVVPLCAWTGWTQPLVVAASIGAPAFAVFVYVKFRRRLRRV